MHALMVTQPFGNREVGEIIAGDEEMEAALATNPAFVVRVQVPETPAVEQPADPAQASDAQAVSDDKAGRGKRS